MATRVAVLIPGIMGSVLYTTRSGTRDEIWSGDFLKNYNLLVRRDPTLLRWNGTPAQASLLENIYPMLRLPLVPSYIPR